MTGLDFRILNTIGNQLGVQEHWNLIEGAVIGVVDINLLNLVKKRDLLASYLGGTCCHKTGTRPPSCVTPRQTTIHVLFRSSLGFRNLLLVLTFLGNIFPKLY